MGKLQQNAFSSWLCAQPNHGDGRQIQHSRSSKSCVLYGKSSGIHCMTQLKLPSPLTRRCGCAGSISAGGGCIRSLPLFVRFQGGVNLDEPPSGISLVCRSVPWLCMRPGAPRTGRVRLVIERWKTRPRGHLVPNPGSPSKKATENNTRKQSRQSFRISKHLTASKEDGATLKVRWGRRSQLAAKGKRKGGRAQRADISSCPPV